jgi:UDP-N-acetylglucosamine 2-epimerase (non-hydrolysing)
VSGFRLIHGQKRRVGALSSFFRAHTHWVSAFAPTPAARHTLLCEGIAADTIRVTANAVIDALLQTAQVIQQRSRLRRELDGKLGFLNGRKTLLLSTGHQRESFGRSTETICCALAEPAR